MCEPRSGADRAKDFLARREVMWIAIAALFLAWVGLAVVSWSTTQNTQRLDTVAQGAAAVDLRIDRALAGSCARTQTIRDDLNANEWRDRARGIAAARAFDAIAGVGRLVARTEPVVGQLVRPLAAGSRAFRVAVADSMYLPPTDCRRAVASPLTYRAPCPVPFAEVADRYDPRRNPRPHVPSRSCRS